MPFAQSLTETAKLVDALLSDLLDPENVRAPMLIAAMRHAALAPGKRLRPFLLIESARLFGLEGVGPLRAAAALECVHCYSLVHDDLPAMDDDDLRRGRPAVHIAYDEATAILTGDALLTLAFEILSDDATHQDAAVRVELIGALAKAAGSEGMVGGQMRDLEAERTIADLDAITHMQSLKTGALMEFACFAGARLAGAQAREHGALRAYARDIGLAFQISDDLLDAESTSANIGKRTLKDADRGKATFVALMGPTRARQKAEELVKSAIEHIALFGARAHRLGDAAQYIVHRRH